LIDKAYAQAGAAASNEDVYRVFENQTKANPYQLRSAVSKLGFVPNFSFQSKTFSFGKKALPSAAKIANQVLFDGIIDMEEVAMMAEWAKAAGPEALRKLKGLLKRGKLNETSKVNLQKLDNLTVRLPRQNRNNAASGFLPNFANPLQDAVGREMAAGVPASQIYIDKNSSLKNAMNPMGLMVANRRDEPAGGFQGINRARKEGANPMTYGAAGGFVPNYAVGGSGADLTNFIGLTRKEALGKESQLYTDALNKLTAELTQATADHKKARGKNRLALADQIKALQENELTLKDSSKATRQAIREQTKGVLGTGKTATGLVTGKKTTIKDPTSVGGNRDMLGTIFAVQGALSVLTGATDGASNSVAKFTNIVSSSIGSFATAAFAIQGAGQIGGTIGAMATKLGPYGLAIAGTLAAFSAGGKIMDEVNGINKSVASNMARVAEAAEKAAVKLEDLSPTGQLKVKESAKNLVSGATMLSGVMKAEFEGFDSFGFAESDIEKSLKTSVESSLAAGVSYGLMWKKINEAAESGSEVTKEEVSSLIKYFNALQLSSENVKKAFGGLNLNIESGLGKDIVESGGNLKGPPTKRYQEAIKKLQNELQRTNPNLDVNSSAGQKLIQDQVDILNQSKEDSNNQSKEAVDQVRTSLVQDKLKNALANAIAEARSFENDELAKTLLFAQELGNLDEKGLRDLQDKIALREIDKKLTDETRSIIESQIDKAKKITSDAPEAVALETKFNNLTEEDLRNPERLKQILTETSKLLIQERALSDAEADALTNKIDQLLITNGLERDSLKSNQDLIGTYKEQAKQLDLISQASKRALEAQSFNREIGVTKSINASDLQVRALESSKLGASDTQVRQIDQQIAAIKESTVIIEQANAREKIFSDFKTQLQENNKITDKAIKADYDNQIKEAKTAEQLQGLAGLIMMARGGESADSNMSQVLTANQKFKQD